jgi:hypothetical protein
VSTGYARSDDGYSTLARSVSMQNTVSPAYQPPELYQLIISELLLQPDKQLKNLPGMGRGIWITDDYALCWSTEKLYRRVQSDWIESAPDSVPLPDWIRVLKATLADRIHQKQKRIEALQSGNWALQKLIRSLENSQPEEFLATLREHVNSRKP